MKAINADIECYLSPMAKKAVDELVYVYDMDFDLAVSIVEQMGSEEEVWELPEDAADERQERSA